MIKGVALVGSLRDEVLEILLVDRLVHDTTGEMASLVTKELGTTSVVDRASKTDRGRARLSVQSRREKVGERLDLAAVRRRCAPVAIE